MTTPFGDHLLLCYLDTEHPVKNQIRAVFRSGHYGDLLLARLAINPWDSQIGDGKPRAAVWTYSVQPHNVAPTPEDNHEHLVWRSPDSIAMNPRVLNTFKNAVLFALHDRWAKRHTPFDVRSGFNRLYEIYEETSRAYEVMFEAWIDALFPS